MRVVADGSDGITKCGTGWVAGAPVGAAVDDAPGCVAAAAAPVVAPMPAVWVIFSVDCWSNTTRAACSASRLCCLRSSTFCICSFVCGCVGVYVCVFVCVCEKRAGEFLLINL